MVIGGYDAKAMDSTVSLEDEARAFLGAALGVLRDEHVVPPSRYQPFLHVGDDYVGATVGGSEYVAFEKAIAKRHPRFSDDTPIGERDFAHMYLFSFLEAFVAEVTLRGEDCSPDAPSFDRCVDSLVSAVDAGSWEVACCREVSNLTTTNGETLHFDDVTVIPLTGPAHEHRREAARAIAKVIPHAQSAYGRTPPEGWDPPHSIVVARDHSPDPYETANTISGRIGHFLFIARLLHSATCDSLYEIQGETALVRRFEPNLRQFRGSAGSLWTPSIIRRTACLEPQDIPRFAGLAGALASVEGEPQAMLLSSFGIAKHRFQMSYHAYAWYEQLVDLAIALEAALSGTDKNDVLLRLRTRAAALLATENDPAGSIFDDIGLLYGLRSQLIHGNALSEKTLQRSVRSITTVPGDSLLGEAIDHAIDRLRDLVRRALLARVCLAACDPPLWKLNEEKGIDTQLIDASTRNKWCSIWRDFLRSFDAQRSADRPRPAVGLMSRDDLSGGGGGI